MPHAAPASLRVVRYARDAGFAPVEWARALAQASLDPTSPAIPTTRVGVQITKTRLLDVFVRVEALDTPGKRLRARLNRSESDRLFRRPRQLRQEIPLARRPLAVLSATLAGRPVRLLVAEPTDPS